MIYYFCKEERRESNLFRAVLDLGTHKELEVVVRGSFY